MHSLDASLIPEWSPQTAVLVAWPSPRGDFNPWLAEVVETYVAIAREVLRHQILVVACQSQELAESVRQRLAAEGCDISRLRPVVISYDDVWVRDTAPLSVGEGNTIRWLDFRFNGWGDKYPHADDARLAGHLHASNVLGQPEMDAIDFVLEGGSIEVDGAGTLMTTSRCVLNPNRNPSFNRSQIEAMLKARFGVRQILMLEYGHAEGDDTDAHIDTLARFAPNGVIAYTACDDPEDPLYEEFQRMEDQLKTFRDLAGSSYQLVALPMPRPIRSEEGDRLPATYANFLIINEAVLVPVYGDPKDELALSRLAAVFEGRDVVPIPCTPLIRQYGSLHCMTMQFPL